MTALVTFDPRFQCYAITDQASSHGRDDELVAAGLLLGGSTCLQYRAKKVGEAERQRVAFALRRMTRDVGALFIVNDRVDLALDADADGVHLGQDDLSTDAARDLARRVGRHDFLIGRSTHSMAQALAALREGVDYIGYGPIFATRTKENNVPPVGPESITAVVEAIPLPVVVIGGIKLDTIADLATFGARHCAVVTALTSAEDVAAASREHWRVWRQARD